MRSVTESRRVAASILLAVSRGRRLDLAFGDAVTGLSDQDRRWVQEASYGTVRLRGRLDFLLDQHLRKGISSLAPPLLSLLRLGAYQLLQMGGVPAYAAISQTVDQVKEVSGKGGSRLANGVLRNLEREGGGADRFPSLDSDPEGHLSTWGSHPRWMIRRWLSRWGPEAIRTLVEWNNTPPPLYFRPLGISREKAESILLENGIASQGPAAGLPCLQLPGGTNPAKILDLVPGIIQDPGAALVTVYADVHPGSVIGDLCAAPGGKALAMAADGAYVLAADRSHRRLRLLHRSRERVGGRIELISALAENPPFRELPFVLLDVPCSGTGTIRRHPDARWRMRQETIEELVEVQARILNAGGRLIPPGGVLIYSTCSLEPEENLVRVESFLAKNPQFSLEESGTVLSEYLDEKGCLSVAPQSAGFDGAFAARMVRKS